MPRVHSGLLLPAVLILLGVPVLIHPLPFFPDDALFYPQIAWHVVQGHGSTFNGIESTNGYHPLQMLVTIMAMAAVGCRKMPALRLGAVIEFVWLGLAIVAFARTEDRRGRSAMPGAALLVFGYGTALFGLETHLSLAAIAWWLYEMDRCTGEARDELASWRRFGIASAAVCLARLDNVFLVCAGAVIALAGADLRGLVCRAIAITETAAPPIALYLAWNHAQFGHLVPISGAIKSAFPHLTIEPSYVGRLGAIVSAIAAASLIDAIVEGDLVMLAASIGTLLQAGYILFFAAYSTTSFAWYWTVGAVNLALFLDRFFPRGLGATAATALVVLALTRGWTRAFGYSVVNPLRPLALDRFDPTDPSFVEGASRWIEHNLPPDAIVLAVDAPGNLAYLSGRRIVALDGLTNDYAFDDKLKRDGIIRYAQQVGADYYFGPSPRCGEAISYPFMNAIGSDQGTHTSLLSPLTRAPAGEFELRRDAALVDFNNAATRGHGHFAIWRLSDMTRTRAKASPSDPDRPRISRATKSQDDESPR